MRINAYHDKQKKYEIEQFEKYLSEYPGTVRGPRPEDDPQAYREYALKKMPRILFEELRLEQALKVNQEEPEAEEDEVEGRGRPFIRSMGSRVNTLGKDRLLLDEDGSNKEKEAAIFGDIEEGFENQQILDGCTSEVPLMPSLEFENYQYFINYWTSWLEFRNSYIQHNREEKIK